MPHVESRLRVRYKETDQMGIAHHANYIVWFEIGRTDLCRATGFPYNEIESRGYILFLTYSQCRYAMSYRYDDEVLMRTSVADLASRSIRFAYELYDARGESLHANGTSSHLWLEEKTRRPVRADGEVQRAFEAWIRAS